MIHKNLAMLRVYAPKRSSTIFGGKFLVSRYRKTSWGNAFVFQKISSTEKIYGEERSVTFFRRKFFVSRRRRTSWANPSVFQKYSGIKIFWIIGVSRLCRMFSLTVPKNFVKERFCLSEKF